MSVSREVQAAKPVRLPVRVTSNNPSRRGLRSVVAGGITGGINICIVFPTEFIKATESCLGMRASAVYWFWYHIPFQSYQVQCNSLQLGSA